MRKFKAIAASIAIGMSSLIAVGPALAAPRTVVTQHHYKPSAHRPGNHKPQKQRPGNHKPGKHQPPHAGPKRPQSHAAWHKRDGKMPKAHRSNTASYRHNRLKQPPRETHSAHYDETSAIVAISAGIIATVLAATH
ncbi:hypothetical protein [Breoghania sp.]|uniref:hypothetical protein n=1 Tax=Breoghania sp. TaxID=2065378 RepID=UPI002AA911FC|nr:hypothetical protein [Breoghania sp.]